MNDRGEFVEECIPALQVVPHDNGHKALMPVVMSMNKTVVQF